MNTVSCDIFCRVIDNFGDAGVAWRLARSLNREKGMDVRLIIDDLLTLSKIVPEIDPEKTVQTACSIDVVLWDDIFENRDPHTPARAVIEAFSCHLPQNYEKAIAQRHTLGFPIAVIALDYLTAESWAEDFHGLPSPHPIYGYPKTFFFPGFSDRTGGFCIENDLEERRQEFLSGNSREVFLREVGADPTHPFTLFVFTYPEIDAGSLAHALCNSNRPVQALLAPGKAREAFIAALADCNNGNVRVIELPMITQSRFDELLWSCDALIVRGEDSATRAMLSGKPFIWTLYPQTEETHIVKMKAFEATLEGLYEDDALIARNRLEETLNRQRPVNTNELIAWLDSLQKQREGSEKYLQRLHSRSAMTEKISQVILNRLK